MAINMEDYKDDFEDTGLDGKEPVKPEDEFFHSIYIGHTARKNHIGVIEEAGKFHVRGVHYNLNEVYGIISVSKKILVKTKRVNNKDQTDCFSFQEGQFPYKGTSGNVCGLNSNERALNPFCTTCRAQLIVTMILCDSVGTPYKTEDGKPIFGFIKGKGMRYAGVADYIASLKKIEFPPIVQPVTEHSKDWEKKHINQSRVVTKITRDLATSSYNSTVNVFKLEMGPQIPDKAVEKIMQITKQTMDKFKEKFDWSKTRTAMAAAASSYSTVNSQSNVQTFGETINNSPTTIIPTQNTTPQNNPTVESSKTSQPSTNVLSSYDDLAF